MTAFVTLSAGKLCVKILYDILKNGKGAVKFNVETQYDPWCQTVNRFHWSHCDRK